MGKQGPVTMKSKTRALWEQELHRTKLSNDDICDVLIKRAMEGIPLNAPLDDIVEEKTPVTRKNKVEPPLAVESESSSLSGSDDDDDGNISLKQIKLSFEKTDDESSTKTSRLVPKAKVELLEGLEPLNKNKKAKTYARKLQNQTQTSIEAKPHEAAKSKTSIPEVVESKKEPVVEKPKELSPPPKPEETAPPFNIMDHVCTIKVNGVGILFQCKLCNRNFLKKDIVMNHGCAKNNAPPKETNTANTAPPGPPKPSTVKYIKMDKDFKRPLSSLTDKTVVTPTKTVEPEAKPKARPKAGPASRIKVTSEPPKEIPKEPTPPPKPTPQEVPSIPPSVSFPSAPSLNSRYKLVAGPNNTFQLVEEASAPEEKPIEKSPVEEKSQSKSKKRRANDSILNKSKHHRNEDIPTEKSSSPEVIDLDANESQKPEPYPVGLFQPVPHHSSVYPAALPPVPFTTPAMKKQSYTIVQTGNPSKLLISTKPQPAPEEPSKKKSKKKTEGKEKEPFTVTVEDDAPQKDPSFFTFVSLDPLLQPSYVLPTDNIIQESQITTSTPGAKPAIEKDKDKYPYACNMCGDTFSREKKLLAHIQTHYNQMDEEDEMRTAKIPI
ncbi:Uncharacterized protein OBRU01_09443 [Operophtera brumata]|uniref:C2H2-type domain-containing protein n=1 Tax=Operophtera brumata TaxID=104452 RepID=A0A0L7LFA9_OPEBR|nr:Uncharacterized protein OBRU01_09443 [Operophtera brumata]